MLGVLNSILGWIGRQKLEIMKAFRSVASVLLFLVALPAVALEISYTSINPFDGTVDQGEGLLLKGEIRQGDYAKLLSVIRRDEDRFWRSVGFILASPGGNVYEALRIARLIRYTYSSAFVGDATGPCASACFFIFATAARREASPRRLGIHRPYLSPEQMMSLSPREAENVQREILRISRAYLEDLQVPTSLIDAMFQRASTEVHWLSRAEFEQQLGRRPPWYEQFLIARCGFDKALERRFFNGNDQAALEHLREVDSCAYRLTRKDAESFLKEALSGKAAK